MDNNNDGISDDYTDWTEIKAGEFILNIEQNLKGNKFKVKIRMNSSVSTESPMIRSFELLNNKI